MEYQSIGMQECDDCSDGKLKLCIAMPSGEYASTNPCLCLPCLKWYVNELEQQSSVHLPEPGASSNIVLDYGVLWKNANLNTLGTPDETNSWTDVDGNVVVPKKLCGGVCQPVHFKKKERDTTDE